MYVKNLKVIQKKNKQEEELRNKIKIEKLKPIK
jgi:hypothetical protein